MKIAEFPLTEEILQELIGMSADWEMENSCHGYRTNERSDIEPNRIFLAKEGGETLGYLFGRTLVSHERSAVMPEQSRYFELEELYVKPEYRSRGVGRALYEHAENAVRAEGCEYVMVATATKDYRRILHFYIEEMGMDFWSARLFKKI